MLCCVTFFGNYLGANGASTSFQPSRMQSSRDIYRSFGERHTKEHFPTLQHLSDALLHQLKVLSIGSETVGEENIPAVRDIGHPFMSCTPYLEYDALKLSLAEKIGDSFESHLSYTSATDNQICFVVFVRDTSSLHVFMDSLKANELSLFVPVPDVLKLDYSVLRALDWITEQVQETSSHPTIKEDQQRSASSKHPILDDIAKGEPIELSIIFRPSWSPASQEETVSKWFESLLQKTESAKRQLSSEKSHWNSFVWTSESLNDNGHDVEDHLVSHHSGHLLQESENFSSIQEGIEKISTYNDNFGFGATTILKKNLGGSFKIEGSDIRKKWANLQETFLGLHSDEEKSSNTTEGVSTTEDKCDYAGISVTHRKNNVILIFGTDFFKHTNRSAACLANIVVLLCADKGVSRMALSQSPKILNNVARKITQSAGATTEPYSNAGLNGTGVVVGLSDTGIDENSCYFSDIKGFIPRSKASTPFTDLGYRKIVQYVDFSGSGGDDSGGHGTHVAGSIAGYSQSSGNLYKGMASGSKIAFFDIAGEFSYGLSLPDDLAVTLFPPAYSAGARLHSNSWGGGYFYDAYCTEVDQYLYQHSDFLILFAAGNSGDYGSGFVIAPGLSKNALTVGATVNALDSYGDMAYFSSTGPTFDGRVKPDIVAPGYSVTSAYATQESYSYTSCDTISKAGTSMATPVVAGTAALMIQYFKDPKFWVTYCNPAYPLCKNGAFSPLGPTVKALLLHSAVAMNIGSTVLPDMTQGYGRVDLLNVLPLVKYSKSPYTLFLDQATLKPLTEFSYKVAVRTATQPLKVTISWFDPPNAEFAARVLIHDLDLLLVSPSGIIFYGNGGVGVRDEINNVRKLYHTGQHLS